MKKNKSRFIRRFTVRPLLLLCAALGCASLHAENVFITSFFGNAGTADLTQPPHCVFTNFNGTFGAGSASMSTATPSPGVAPRRVQYSGNPGAAWSMTPSDEVVTSSDGKTTTFTSLQNIGVYKIYLTKGQSGKRVHQHHRQHDRD